MPAKVTTCRAYCRWLFSPEYLKTVFPRSDSCLPLTVCTNHTRFSHHYKHYKVLQNVPNALRFPPTLYLHSHFWQYYLLHIYIKKIGMFSFKLFSRWSRYQIACWITRFTYKSVFKNPVPSNSDTRICFRNSFEMDKSGNIELVLILSILKKRGLIENQISLEIANWSSRYINL